MEDLTRRVKHVLAVYLERGKAALQALADGKVDEAREILALRNAAFHNLKAVDADALGRGDDAARDPEVLALWDATRPVDVALNEALAKARDDAKRSYERVRTAREKLGKFRAKSAESTSFVKTA